MKKSVSWKKNYGQEFEVVFESFSMAVFFFLLLNSFSVPILLFYLPIYFDDSEILLEYKTLNK